jgi:hypothetical protein
MARESPGRLVSVLVRRPASFRRMRNATSPGMSSSSWSSPVFASCGTRLQST